MAQLSEMDWDHLRVFLTVMRSSSLRQAAEKLGVSHPTARRKVEALETELGLHLFDRRNDGLHATPAAAELVEMAEEVEASVLALRRRALDADPDLRGPVRVTVPNVIATHLLMPEFAAFSKRHPQIELQVDMGYDLADLGSREADVAIRAVRVGKSPSPDLTGRKAVTMFNAVYGAEHQWIGWKGEAEDREWVGETEYPDLPIRGALNDPLLQLSACENGMGLTMLPCFLADGVLTRRTRPKPYADVWVLVHPDLRRSPRLRVFRDEMVANLKLLKSRLQGKAR